MGGVAPTGTCDGVDSRGCHTIAKIETGATKAVERLGPSRLDSLGEPPEIAAMNEQVAENGPTATGHERGKAERRRQILWAAISIINEKGEDGLTVRAIAARAEISPVTVYNLSGSKYAIIKSVV